MNETMNELLRLQENLPALMEQLNEQEYRACGGRGRVRATCTGSQVSRIEIDPNFLHTVDHRRVETAVLEAVGGAQQAASQRLESLQFLGIPIGEVLSGKRELADVIPAVPDNAMGKERLS